ncbi:porin [Haemophilus sp. oral taxon 851]|uniref:porin n=1 Tax=Haemophilus sp. oral taxon 851 TaxID=762964 RepID=UPI0002461DD8|nr:porin [Haemophilus sp. oral taxon 851]EHO47281.1 Gram-negative porin [Haemophilus sp. oral taxon 851 str. F0397]
MKKTLAALIIGAFAASAANAAVVYDNEGTKVEVDGSIRLILQKTNKEGAGHTHSGLKNDGSRFGFTVNHQLNDGYYALARLETRLKGDAKGDDEFGNITAHRAFAGIGHKERGQLTFGRQTTIADKLVTANDYSYGLIEKDRYIPNEGNSVIRYDYNGIEGLVLSASYQFANKRDSENEVDVSTDNNRVIKNGFQLGAIYDANNVIAKFAYGRTNYGLDYVQNEDNPDEYIQSYEKSHRDGFLTSLGYRFGNLTVSVDSGYAKVTDKDSETKVTQKHYFVSPGFQYKVSELSNIYGNYKYEKVKEYNNVNTDTTQYKTNGFLLGVDYKLHKQAVVFLEGKYQVEKLYEDGAYAGKAKDKAIGVGLRVFF